MFCENFSPKHGITIPISLLVFFNHIISSLLRDDWIGLKNVQKKILYIRNNSIEGGKKKCMIVGHYFNNKTELYI